MGNAFNTASNQFNSMERLHSIPNGYNGYNGYNGTNVSVLSQGGQRSTQNLLGAFNGVSNNNMVQEQEQEQDPEFDHTIQLLWEAFIDGRL